MSDRDSQKVELCLSQEMLLEIDLLVAECHESDIDRSEVIEGILTWSTQSDFHKSRYILNEIKQQNDT
ncbi:hypothetical protein [Haloquadratum walsbyi]|jgi:hypothetical protein|uniref:Ribbon-helix-helix protein CopG domain-containing protein n=1 Tax=Haloquadratum walsbyi J07HQW2 TaxID=1238425 RepID=U1PTT6_9EURY|nr:hypothetical protein [Haloquadratum walsbyi]ERG95801.1 MAG: hypothetical protein J07HQW2_02261 [Haloquadratum walsbyi J07HQW2]